MDVRWARVRWMNIQRDRANDCSQHRQGGRPKCETTVQFGDPRTILHSDCRVRVTRIWNAPVLLVSSLGDAGSRSGLAGGQCPMSLTPNNCTTDNCPEVDPWSRSNIGARRAACARWRRKNHNPCLRVFGAGIRGGVRAGSRTSARLRKPRNARQRDAGSSTPLCTVSTAPSRSIAVAMAILRAHIPAPGCDRRSKPAAELASRIPPDFEGLAAALPRAGD